MAFADDQWFALGMRDLGGSGEEDGTQDAAIWRSDDGRTWVAAEIRAVDAEGDYSVVHDLVDVDGVLVAIGSWGAMQSDQLAWVTWLSTDGGATWTESRDTPGPFGAMQAITPGGPGLVAAGWTYAGTIPYDSYFVTSRDGMAWDEVGAPLVAAAVHGLGALGERLVAVGVDWTDPPLAYEAQPTAWYSDDDGETWTAVELPGAAPDNLDHPQDVVPFNDGLVAVGGSMDVGSWITPDGETWERFDVALNAAFGAGAALDGALVAVGNTPLAGGQEIGPGVTWTSRDAQSWSAGPVLSEGGVGLRAVAESDGVVVAGGTCDRVDPCQAVMWRGEVVR
jgi:hypothetical protein